MFGVREYSKKAENKRVKDKRVKLSRVSKYVKELLRVDVKIRAC